YSAFFRPRESIFALGAHLCDRPEHHLPGGLQGVVGSNKAGPLAREGRGIYEAQFPYVKGRLGGYGLYYAGVIAGMGLALPGLPSAGLAFDAPTPEGRAVAAALRSAVAGTRYYQEFFDDDDAEVPTEGILEYIRVACLCQLQTRSAPDRPILQD